MNFDNLPDDWPTIPLDDPDHIADVLDLFVGMKDRQEGSLVVLICDDRRRPIQPVIGPAPAMPTPEFARFLEPLAEMLATQVPGGTVLCALARRRPLRVTMRDRAWRRCLEAAFSGRVELIGVHLITLDGCLPIPSEDAAA